MIQVQNKETHFRIGDLAMVEDTCAPKGSTFVLFKCIMELEEATKHFDLQCFPEERVNRRRMEPHFLEQTTYSTKAPFRLRSNLLFAIE